MKLLLALSVVALVAQPGQPRLERRTFKTPDGTIARYGLAVPRSYDASSPRPLVVALHPGGGAGMLFYGDRYMRSVFLPGLSALGSIMIAPDAPLGSWTEPKAEQMVLALIDAVGREFSIDSRRTLVAGYSMGGAGAWYLSARHQDRFAGAIVIAGRTGEPIETLARIPTYVIHGRDDEVVPFAQAEARAAALERMGRPVRFEALMGASHYAMGGYMAALSRGGRWISDQWNR
ncbi:MAG: hypothetical protein A3H29_18005 [Acidobacteria bacterium RIFCSPLOWO2_02_FULL_67_21]|nr:MAG: hypothetical protein A3H29_18005 [Acidobacteria bacterium RIFCSPLOWO2_02_FULL_67_21]